MSYIEQHQQGVGVTSVAESFPGFLQNSFRTDAQIGTNPGAYPAVAGLPDGGFVVTWGSSTGTWFQRFDNFGSASGPEIFVGAGELPSISALSNGQIVITNVLNGRAKVFTFDSQSALIRTSVATPQGITTQESEIFGLSNGNYVLAWEQYDPTRPYDLDVKMQVFNSSGEKIGSEMTPHPNTAGDQFFPHIASLRNGAFVVVLSSYGPSSNDSVIQLYDAAGASLRPPMTIGSSSGVIVTGLANGGFALAWGEAERMLAQSFDGFGNAIGTPAVFGGGGGGRRMGIAAADDGFVVTYERADSNSIPLWGQLFTSNGTLAGPEFLISDTGLMDVESQAAGLANGDFAVVWTSNGQSMGTTLAEVFSVDLDETPTLSDDFADNSTDPSAPVGTLTNGVPGSGIIELADADDSFGDKDVFKVHLLANQAYRFELDAGSLPLGQFTIRDADDFNSVRKLSVAGDNVSLLFTPDREGDYFVRVGSGGASTDVGSYTLIVHTVTSGTGPDDLPDYPGDPHAIFPPTTLRNNYLHGAQLETSGDRDLFSFTVVKGHRYQLTVDGRTYQGNPALADVMVTIRNGSDFAPLQPSRDGTHQVAFSFIAEADGPIYIQVGAGGSGIATGHYAVSIFNAGLAVVRTRPDPRVGTATEAAFAWFEEAVANVTGRTLGYLLNSDLWKDFAIILARMGDEEAAEVANHIGLRIRALQWAVRGKELVEDVRESDNPVRELVVGVSDLVAEFIVTQVAQHGTGILGGAAAGSLSAGVAIPLGAAIGRIVGEIGGEFIYDKFLQDDVREYAGDWYDEFVEPLLFAPLGAAEENAAPVLPGALAAGGESNDFDESRLIRFDAAWYLATYPDAAATVANGQAGSAYSHFLTLGIDLGNQPNPTQSLSRADLPSSVPNDDPLAQGIPVLLSMALGTHGGDGISAAELALASALNQMRGASPQLFLDRQLAAAAARKAADLIANEPDGGVDLALAAADSGWAGRWSNGNELTQQFGSFFVSLLGDELLLSRYAFFVVASSGGAPANLLSLLGAQPGFAEALGNGAFDTLGVAEYGGLWVVFVADRQQDYLVEAPPAEASAGISVYGELANDVLYAGTRSAALRGLDGDDQLFGSSGADILDGGLGNDTANYSATPSAVSVNLAISGVAQNTGNGGTDTLIDIENLVGSAYGDMLIGNGLANLLDGGAGADMMRGGSGADVYVVDNSGDIVEESPAQGIDEIRTTLAIYSLAGLENVENLTALNGIAHDFRGNSGGNAITGGAGNDNLRLQDGGDDTVLGGAGADNIFMIGSLTAADIVSGGEGNDTLILQGDYAGGLTLTENVTQIELISILAGSNTNFGEPGTNRHDYVLTTHDANFSGAIQVRVNGSALLEGEDFTFDGSAELDSRFVVYGGRGVDTLTGSRNNDIFFLAEERFATGDTVNGGAGYDGMFLRGNYTIDFNAPGYTGLFTNIENLTLTSATDERYARGGGTEFDYNLTLSDAIVKPGETLTVSGTLLMASETMIVDGSAESDGLLSLFGGKAGDTLKGGGQSDVLYGNLGADQLAGNGGADVFRYNAVAESTAGSIDHVLDFASGTDKIDLGRVDADSNVAGNQGFSWIGSNAFSGSAGELRAYQDGASWFVEGDTNGDGVADLVIQLDVIGGPLSQGDFLP